MTQLCLNKITEVIIIYWENKYINFSQVIPITIYDIHPRTISQVTSSTTDEAKDIL